MPKCLGEQFQKQANSYFLVVIALMFIGTHTNLWIGTIAAWSTAAMLFSMVSISMVVSWYDDKARERSDESINERRVLAVNRRGVGGSSPLDIQWQDVIVGDLLILKENSEVPADMVIMAANSRSGGGLCYVSTAQLDGETDLKVKHAVLSSQSADELDGLPSGYVNVETPHADLYSFCGNLKVTSSGKFCGSQFSLSMDSMILRGCVVKNTQTILGLVVYTGNDTRIAMNSQAPSGKLSSLERAINFSMWVAVALQALLALSVDIVFNKEKSTLRQLWYIYPNGYKQPEGALPDILAYLLSFFVLYSNFVPVSLYATMEVCNTAYAYFISHDSRMECAVESGGDGKRVRATARATNLCHELGQVSYIFSDKTGTLTKNIMTLLHVATPGVPGRPGCVLDIAQGGPNGSEPMAHMGAFDHIWEILSVCHTGAWNPGGEKLEFESPDEEALVHGAGLRGWRFWQNVDNVTEIRRTNARGVSEKGGGKGAGAKVLYEILAVNKFTSARKRMSVVVKKDGEHFLLMKGADSAMELCTPGGLPESMQRQLFEFSTMGLRTLVLGMKNLADFDLEGWMKLSKAADLSTANRTAEMEKLASAIEKNVSVVGCTAIEDELQDGVGETIVKLEKAGIKIWVLTGDKMETAISIGYSTKLLQHHGMDILVIATDSERSASLDANVKFCDLNQASQAVELDRTARKKGLVITGNAMREIMKDTESRLQFVSASKLCEIVILARCSPLQKAQMVKLIRDDGAVRKGILAPVTLAIGDGANDVPMIMAAQVGVGIVGREGHQAANNADFAIGQFRFLENLLFVHGRTNYRRACKFTIFTFWRNAVQVILMCYYTPMSGYSGTTLFEDNLRITFNFLCSIPILAIGLFDCDIHPEQALSSPELYMYDRGGGFELTPLVMVRTMGSALVHSAIIMSALLCVYAELELNQAGDYWSIGCLTYTLLIHAAATRAAFITSTWNVWSVAAFGLSYALYGVFLARPIRVNKLNK